MLYYLTLTKTRCGSCHIIHINPVLYCYHIIAYELFPLKVIKRLYRMVKKSSSGQQLLVKITKTALNITAYRTVPWDISSLKRHTFHNPNGGVHVEYCNSNGNISAVFGWSSVWFNNVSRLFMWASERNVEWALGTLRCRQTAWGWWCFCSSFFLFLFLLIVLSGDRWESLMHYWWTDRLKGCCCSAQSAIFLLVE